jgi:hypothetical protein
VSLINPDVTGEKQQKDSFLELIRDPVISTRYPTQSDVLRNNAVYYSQLRDAVNNKAPIQFMGYKNNVLLFTHEKIIQIKSNFNPSFLYDKINPTEKRSLDFSTDNKGSQSTGDALQKLLEKRKKVILPKF